MAFWRAHCASLRGRIDMSVKAVNPKKSADIAKEPLPKLGFEHIRRAPTASQITKCADLQKEPAKLG